MESAIASKPDREISGEQALELMGDDETFKTLRLGTMLDIASTISRKDLVGRLAQSEQIISGSSDYLFAIQVPGFGTSIINKLT